MVVQLHGYYGANPPYVGWYFVDSRHAPINTEYADNKDVIVLEPHGRGNTSYLGLGERYIVRLLQRWGFDVRYKEHPGMGHEDLKAANDIINWFLLRKRDANPRHVRLRSADLKTASAYWVRVEQSADPFAFMVVDAEFVGRNTIRLDSQNVLELTLTPGPPLIDPGKPLKVTRSSAPSAIDPRFRYNDYGFRIARSG